MTIKKAPQDVRQARTNTHLRIILAGSMILAAIAFWVLLSIY
ncbi:MAG: hypothetical protein AAGI12_00950 [Pseudomonadota bacterium]